MLYEEWKSRYKNLKNFNTVLQRCPRFWPLAPPRGMNPGVYSLGISEDPPRYLSSKFDASVRSDCWDISIWKTLTQCDGNGNANANANANANVDDRGDYNSSPCTSYRRAKNNMWMWILPLLIWSYVHVRHQLRKSSETTTINSYLPITAIFLISENVVYYTFNLSTTATSRQQPALSLSKGECWKKVALYS